MGDSRAVLMNSREILWLGAVVLGDDRDDFYNIVILYMAIGHNGHSQPAKFGMFTRAPVFPHISFTYVW